MKHETTNARSRRFELSNASPILGWAVLTGLIVWGAFVLWQNGLLARLTTEDPSKLSWVILALYFATQCYAGWLALNLHRDGRIIEDHFTRNGIDDGPTGAAHPLIVHFRNRSAGGLTRGEEDDQHDRLRAILADRLSSGWFIADLMFKLGLIGTVIGFIVMLGAITDLRSMDINQAQRMLGDMSAGMRLALYTTLAGLSCGALVGLQFHMMERSAERLARRAAYLMATDAAEKQPIEP